MVSGVFLPVIFEADRGGSCNCNVSQDQATINDPPNGKGRRDSSRKE